MNLEICLSCQRVHFLNGSLLRQEVGLWSRGLA